MNITKKMLVIILCLSSLFLIGCKYKITTIMQEKLSEVRYNLFETRNEEINIKFTSGFREDPYILNGKSENKVEFGVITVKFLTNTSNKTNKPSFIITLNEMDYDGVFELNPFDQTYVADISTFVLDDEKISILVTWQDFSFSGELKNISSSFNCNHSKALNIFIKEFKKYINALIKENKDFEVYVKIINDPSLELNYNYFYVCLITTTGESYSLIIDPFSQEVLAKNSSKNQVIL